MPPSTSYRLGVVVAIALATSIVLLAGGAGPAAAEHGDLGNFTVTLPDSSDHHPGDQNEEDATVRYFFQGASAFESAGAPDGLFLDAIFVESDAVDFSACDVGNIAAFGLDRGGNNSGTQTDRDLVQHLKTSDYRESGLYLRFYQEEDFGGDPVFMNPEDAIRAQQGDGSTDGPCYTMPEAPGWYQMTGYLNGTTSEGEYAEEDTTSHYFYICDCEDESEARERLGPPPSEEGSEATPTPSGTETPVEDTPTPTATPSSTETPGDDAPTPTADQSTPTSDDNEDDEHSDDAGGGQQSDDDGGGHQSADDSMGSSGIDRQTPTAAEGPGFGAVASLLALVTVGIVARRRF